MTDVLLTHAYSLRLDPKQEAARTPYPALGTLIAASVLRASGMRISFFDHLFAKNELEFGRRLAVERPEIVAIYEDDFNYLTKMCLTEMRQSAFRMTAAAKRYGATVVVHGSDASDRSEEYLQHGAHVVVLGEGEETLRELCADILRNGRRAWPDIKGLAFLDGGKLVRTGPRTVRKDLDGLPFAAWDLVDVPRYRDVWMRRHGFFSLNMVTTRGCPFHCNWCAKPIYGQVYHSRSPEDVVREMQMLRELAAPDHLWFADDIFGLKPGWVRSFSNLLAASNIRIPFKIQARADLLLQDGAIEALRSAGCEEVWIGAESGSQRILDAMEKGITTEQIGRVRRALSEQEIRSGFFLQFGYRGETLEDVRSTIDMVRRLMPDDIGVSISYPLPGTKFYDQVRAELRGKENWRHSDDLAMMFAGTYSPEFYRVLHRYVHRWFRLRQGFGNLRGLATGRFRWTQARLRRIAALFVNLPLTAVGRVRLLYLART